MVRLVCVNVLNSNVFITCVILDPFNLTSPRAPPLHASFSNEIPTTQDKNTWEGYTNISDYSAFRTLHIKHRPCTVLGPPASPLSMLEPHLTILCELDS